MQRDEKQIKGIFAELHLISDYIAKGWYAFNQVGGTGIVDFIVLNPETGELKLIECKSGSHRRKDNSKIHRILDDKQKDFNSKLVEFYGNDKIQISIEEPNVDNIFNKGENNV